jgi:hypothetical protein
MLDLLIRYGGKANMRMLSLMTLASARGASDVDSMLNMTETAEGRMEILNTFERYINAGMSATEGFWGLTPFMAMCYSGHYEAVIKMIKEEGASVRSKALSMFTPLHLLLVNIVRFSKTEILLRSTFPKVSSEIASSWNSSIRETADTDNQSSLRNRPSDARSLPDNGLCTTNCGR